MPHRYLLQTWHDCSDENVQLSRAWSSAQHDLLSRDISSSCRSSDSPAGTVNSSDGCIQQCNITSNHWVKRSNASPYSRQVLGPVLIFVLGSQPAAVSVKNTAIGRCYLQTGLWLPSSNIEKPVPNYSILLADKGTCKQWIHFTNEIFDKETSSLCSHPSLYNVWAKLLCIPQLVFPLVGWLVFNVPLNIL